MKKATANPEGRRSTGIMKCLVAAFCFLQITFANAQSTQTVSGVVCDKNGAGIIGAVVMIDGTQTGTSTDADGRFSIEASPSDLLVASCLGYATSTVEVGGRAELTIVLEEDTMVLNEVVVTALGLSRETKSLSYNVQEVGGGRIGKNQ